MKSGRERIIDEFFEKAKAGKVFFDQLDVAMAESMSFSVLKYKADFFDVINQTTNVLGMDFIQADEDRQRFLKCVEEFYIDGALSGYIEGNHHKLVSDLLSYLCDRDYELGEYHRLYQGNQLWDLLSSETIRLYANKDKFRDLNQLVTILANIPDQLNRNSLIVQIPNLYPKLASRLNYDIRQVLNMVNEKIRYRPSARFFSGTASASTRTEDTSLLAGLISDRKLRNANDINNEIMNKLFPV